LSKHDNGIFGRDEVLKVLFGFGPHESLKFTNDVSTLPACGGSGKKCFVKFQYRQDAVDCFQVITTLTRHSSRLALRIDHTLIETLHGRLSV
jgi:hypothetical protein